MINAAFADREIMADVLMRQLGLEVAPIDEDLIPDIIEKYPEMDFRDLYS